MPFDYEKRKTHLGAYALIRRADDAVLLIRKSRGPYADRWDLPGGRIEFGETPEEALRREVLEETGQQIVEPPVLLAALSHRVTWQPRPEMAEDLHHLGIVYRATAAGEPKAIPDGEDSDGAAWILPAELPLHSLTPFAERALTL